MISPELKTPLKIFTAEVVELPRSKVADFLEEELDPALCARYLEYLIDEREETSTLFHDRLAELYLEMASRAKGGGEQFFFLLLNRLTSLSLIRVWWLHPVCLSHLLSCCLFGAKWGSF